MPNVRRNYEDNILHSSNTYEGGDLESFLFALHS